MRKELHHEPVLKKEVLAFLFFENVQTVFDGTLGLGGHAESILQKFPNITKYIACDLDEQHLEYAQKRLSQWEKKTIFYHTNFSSIKKIIQERKVASPLVIFLDLGLCSNHIDDPDKGFSFQYNGPLRMSFNADEKYNGATLINSESESAIIDILKNFGEEPKAKKIAKAIVEYRKNNPLKTTFELKEIIEKSVYPQERNKTLMRVFQAFRIAVNRELDVLAQTLQDAISIMKTGDRLGVISYHALEDKIVKNYFHDWSTPVTRETEYSLHDIVAPAIAKLITKKPIAPSEEEVFQNPDLEAPAFESLKNYNLKIS